MRWKIGENLYRIARYCSRSVIGAVAKRVISECKEVHDILVVLSDQQEISVLENWLKSSDL